MKKLKFLLGIVLLISGQLFAQDESKLITVGADGNETEYALSDVQRIIFEDDAMTVLMKSGSDESGVTRVSFLLVDSGIKNPVTKSPVQVFPNPVATYLTVTGIDKDMKINLFDLSGKLLQSVTAQDISADINVSSLQQGIYLLQVGNQVIKFVKQ